jgi:hypothetical protein
MSGRSVLRHLGPGVVLAYQVALTVASLALLWAFTSGAWHVRYLDWQDILPLWVPFGGWLGGITISIVGVATHTHDWNRLKYGYWHLARPLLGMVTGTVAVLIVLFVVTGVTGSPVPTAGGTYSPSGVAVLFVVAFVVGFREETFRALVKRVIDVILSPGDASAEQRVELVPSLTVLTATAGGSATGTVAVVNTTSDTFALSEAMPELDPAVSDLQVALGPGAVQVGPGQSAQLRLSWSPGAAAQSTETTLVLPVGGYRLSSQVRLVLTP